MAADCHSTQNPAPNQSRNQPMDHSAPADETSYPFPVSSSSPLLWATEITSPSSHTRTTSRASSGAGSWLLPLPLRCHTRGRERGKHLQKHIHTYTHTQRHTHTHSEGGQSRAEPSRKLFSAPGRAYWRMLEKMSQHTRHVSLVLLFAHIPRFPHFPPFVSSSASFHIPSPSLSCPSRSPRSPTLPLSRARSRVSRRLLVLVLVLPFDLLTFFVFFLSFLRSPSDSAHCAAKFGAGAKLRMPLIWVPGMFPSIALGWAGQGSS